MKIIFNSNPKVQRKKLTSHCVRTQNKELARKALMDGPWSMKGTPYTLDHSLSVHLTGNPLSQDIPTDLRPSCLLLP